MVSYLQIRTNNSRKGTFISRLKKYLSHLVTPSNNNSNNSNINNKSQENQQIWICGETLKQYENCFISCDPFKKIYLGGLRG